MSKIITPCKRAVVVAPKIFPKAIYDLLMGETRISFKNPNSLSQTIDIVDETAIMLTLKPNIPGKKNCTKS